MHNNFNINILTPNKVAEILGVTVGTLSVWRATKRYPLPYIKIGRKVFYKASDIEKFITARTFLDDQLDDES